MIVVGVILQNGVNIVCCYAPVSVMPATVGEILATPGILMTDICIPWDSDMALLGNEDF